MSLFSLPLLIAVVMGPVWAQVKVDEGAGAEPTPAARQTSTTRFDQMFAALPDEPVEAVAAPPVPIVIAQRMQDCMAASVRRDPRHVGRLHLLVDVDAGRVVSTSPTVDEIRDPVLIECAAQQIIGQTVPDAPVASFEWVFIVDGR